MSPPCASCPTPPPHSLLLPDTVTCVGQLRTPAWRAVASSSLVNCAVLHAEEGHVYVGTVDGELQKFNNIMVRASSTCYSHRTLLHFR